MSILEDIDFYVSLLLDSNSDTRNEAHAALRDIGEPSLLGLPVAICRFRLLNQAHRESIIEEVFDTIQTIATNSAKQILDFIVNSEKAGDFWSEDVKVKAKAILEILGKPPPPREDYPIAGIVTQYFIFLVGSENAEERTAAQSILVDLGTENLEYLVEALENGKSLYNDKRKRERLYQFQHPRPQDLIDTIQMMGTENARSALAWIADPHKKLWDNEIVVIAKKAAETMKEVQLDSRKSQYTKWYDHNFVLGDKEVKTCLVCKKTEPKGNWIEDGRRVFCSSTCYQKYKDDPAWRM